MPLHHWVGDLGKYREGRGVKGVTEHFDSRQESGGKKIGVKGKKCDISKEHRVSNRAPRGREQEKENRPGEGGFQSSPSKRHTSLKQKEKGATDSLKRGLRLGGANSSFFFSKRGRRGSSTWGGKGGGVERSNGEH